MSRNAADRATRAASSRHDEHAHALRALVMDGVQDASPTHPGAPLGTGQPITSAQPDRVFDGLPALARHVIGSR